MTSDDAPAGPRRRLAREPIALAAVLLVLLGGTAVLLGAGDDGSGGPKNAGQLDGIVASAQQGVIVFSPTQPFEGKRQVTFEVRPRDAAAVDVQHLQEHSAQGLLTRLYYERDGDKLYAVGQEDLPGTAGGGGVP